MRPAAQPDNHLSISQPICLSIYMHVNVYMIPELFLLDKAVTAALSPSGALRLRGNTGARQGEATALQLALSCTCNGYLLIYFVGMTEKRVER